ncbi:uncharacterized protein TRUGW13939_07907 [Talaromyces rugulosus]|uniref:Rhodopsin domain-containing protein n=1 Tax=Talaromyces rugulosus TaxID=121627 RepID=A0A7H8R503_TALRU|nr:uncharacterized protein TRUGW13939_07907 [Talaromyces rugulosus]QKX60761.1 hypothetical protein TRUGW13939_07907 [Talaromyces rugulosus]
MADVDLNDNAQGGLWAISVIMLVIATVSVIIRTWAVLSDPSRRFGLDDLFVTLSLPFYAGETAMVFWWIKLGLGRHEATISLDDLAQAGKIVFASGFLFNTGLVLPKFSVLFFYHRIFGKSHQWFYNLIWVAASLNLAWLITTYFCAAFQCDPPKAAWTAVPGAKCIPIGRIYVGTSVVSTIIDLVIILMPVPMLVGLQATKTRRALVLIVFLCGYCVIVTSLGRLVTVAKVGAGLTQDITWSDVTYIKWVQCEGALSIASACLPNIMSFGRRLKQHGVRAAVRGKSAYASQGASARHDFRKIGPSTTEESGPKDPYGSDEELRVLTAPQHGIVQTRTFQVS